MRESRRGHEDDVILARGNQYNTGPASASHSFSTKFRVLYLYRTVFGESVHGVINIKDEDGFEPTSESTHLSLPTRYELANGFTSTPSRLLGDLEEKHLPQTFSIATRVAHDGIRIAVTSVRIALSNLKVQHLKDLLESRRSCTCSGAST